MTNIKLAVEKMVEKKQLEGSYGHASCFDFPKEYDKMEELADEIGEILNHDDKVYEIVKTIAFDAYNGNIDLEYVDFSLFSQDDYIEAYLLESMDESGRNMFDSLFYWMNSDDRGRWLEVNYLAGEANIYTDKFIDTIIVMHD